MQIIPEINEEFLGRWANGSLSAEELNFFKAHEEYNIYNRIFNTSTLFEVPVANKENSYTIIKEKINTKKTHSSSLKYWIGGIAASLLVITGLFLTLSSSTSIIETSVAENTLHTLPDGSVVKLNANSIIEYDKNDFLENRKLKLTGEAYFKVAKGSKFTVETTKANVSVLGTEFNVIDRKGIFEANCYEGKVSVSNQKYNEILTASNGVRIINNTLVTLKTDQNEPQWISKVSTFKKVPLYVVINELQNQYPIQINAQNIDQNQLISTSFSHTNVMQALQTVFEPMNIKFTFTSATEIELK